MISSQVCTWNFPDGLIIYLTECKLLDLMYICNLQCWQSHVDNWINWIGCELLDLICMPANWESCLTGYSTLWTESELHLICIWKIYTHGFHSTGCWLLVKFINNYAYSNILWLVCLTDCELHDLHACMQSHWWFCLTGGPGHLIACKLPNIEQTLEYLWQSYYWVVFCTWY